MSEETDGSMVYEVAWEDDGSFALSKAICYCGHDFIDDLKYDNEITLSSRTIDLETLDCPECGREYKVYWDVGIEEVGDTDE